MPRVPAAHAAERIIRTGIIAIVRGDFPTDRLLLMAQALRQGGVEVIEVTLNSAGVLEKIAALRDAMSDGMLVGAGTVRTDTGADAALDAGAQFLVAPNLDLQVVARAREADVLHLPGVFTASEAQTAFTAGCTTVKLFPADTMGPAYLKALRAPLDDIGFVPTGGIHEGNLGDYIRAGAVAVGLGSSLITGPQQDLTAIHEAALRLTSELRRARTEMKRG
jgi:2-dehydro-3-deoxyphosphogluconate aldolase/(4S)-4-hydroxy-2-oxoglutarate aldolase